MPAHFAKLRWKDESGNTVMTYTVRSDISEEDAVVAAETRARELGWSPVRRARSLWAEILDVPDHTCGMIISGVILTLAATLRPEVGWMAPAGWLGGAILGQILTSVWVWWLKRRRSQ